MQHLPPEKTGKKP